MIVHKGLRLTGIPGRLRAKERLRLVSDEVHDRPNRCHRPIAGVTPRRTASSRRSYVTHLIEDGWDAKFVQDQVGHEHSSTTSIYTGVSSSIPTLRQALDRIVADAIGELPAAQEGTR